MASTYESSSPRARPPRVPQTALAVRRLAVQVAAAIDRAGARSVLVTSPEPGCGKSTLMRVLARELALVAPRRFHFSERLPAVLDTVPDGRVWLVEGPSFGAAELMLAQGPNMAAFDAALVVVMGRETRQDALEATVACLEAAGVQPLGLIFNEHASPPLNARLGRARRRLVAQLSGLRSSVRRLLNRVPS